MIDYFLSLDIKVQAALIAALTSLLTFIISISSKNFLERKIHSSKLKSNYEYEQRKLIKDVLAKNKGHLIHSAHSLNGRFKNYTKNYPLSSEWLDRKTYYYKSFLYRILRFFAWIHIIEQDLIFLDTSISAKTDLDFAKYLKVFPEFFHDGDLVNELNVPRNEVENDLIFRDAFKRMFLWMITEDKTVISFNEFEEKYDANYSNFEPLGDYLDNVERDKAGFKADRLFGLQLMLVGLINNYGYDYQETSKKQLNELIKGQNTTRIFKNIRLHVFKKYKINKFKNRRVYCAIKKHSS
ncbi:MAG: hypothetical protein GQ574_07175 [Crocinitomix sp.]|nr:hypothetical protein [Crocinitomix sp.]